MQKTLPQIESISQILSKEADILEWVAKNPVTDHVYRLNRPDDGQNTFQALAKESAIVAGSAALHQLLLWLYPTKRMNWSPGDVDLFFLDHEANERRKQHGLDVVMVKAKTVEEMLVGFDLPICRVAHDMANNYWVSIQCLASIITRKMNQPRYLKDKQSFKQILKLHRFELQPHQRTYESAGTEFMYRLFCERCKKYQKRGYGINWISTMEIIPWVKEKFHYVPWDETDPLECAMMEQLMKAHPEYDLVTIQKCVDHVRERFHQGLDPNDTDFIARMAIKLTNDDRKKDIPSADELPGLDSMESEVMECFRKGFPNLDLGMFQEYIHHVRDRVMRGLNPHDIDFINQMAVKLANEPLGDDIPTADELWTMQLVVSLRKYNFKSKAELMGGLKMNGREDIDLDWAWGVYCQ